MEPDMTTVEDVVRRLMRPLSDVEVAAATALISDASVMIRARYPLASTLALSSPDLAALLAGAVSRAVVRVLSNPDGRVSEAIDDYSWRRADSIADGRLYISGEDWAAIATLLKPELVTDTAAFTISPYAGLR